MAWTRTDDGRQRCEEHGQTFALTQTCADPGCRPVAIEQHDDPPPVDIVAAKDEQWCRSCRDDLISLARLMTEQREEREAIDRVGFSTAAKLYDTALKFHRAAVEVRNRDSDWEREQWLVEQHRRLKGAAH